MGVRDFMKALQITYSSYCTVASHCVLASLPLFSLRWLELREKDPTVIYDRVFNDLVVRDERDETREDSPLKPAEDAVVIDTSLLTADQVFEQALSLIASLQPS